MAPRRPSTSGRQTSRNKPSRCLKKSRTLASPRRSARLQALGSSHASATKSVRPVLLPEPITPSPGDLLQPSGRQQTQCSVNEPPLKRLQKGIPSEKDLWQPLSDENLQTHNRLTRSSPPYNMVNLSIRTLVRRDDKRSASRQSSVSEKSMEDNTFPEIIKIVYLLSLAHSQ